MAVEEELGVCTVSDARPEELGCGRPVGEDDIASWSITRCWAPRRTDGRVGVGPGVRLLGGGQSLG